jgi:organic hydroperoxide reductase OsmC/OhrA
VREVRKPVGARTDGARRSATETESVSMVKTHRFPVDVRWTGGQLTTVAVPGKPELAVATPPEFRGGVAGTWSPEDLLVGSVASCYAVTLAAVAARRGVPLRALEVRSAGDVTRRLDGRFGFTVIELEVRLETAPGQETQARFAAEEAERVCLVTASLDTPVHVEVDVSSAPAAA